MLATDKQINYLESLQKRVKRMNVAVPHRNWRHERDVLGMTATDASARIDAYKRIIQGANLRALLLGFRHF